MLWYTISNVLWLVQTCALSVARKRARWWWWEVSLRRGVHPLSTWKRITSSYISLTKGPLRWMFHKCLVPPAARSSNLEQHNPRPVKPRGLMKPKALLSTRKNGKQKKFNIREQENKKTRKQEITNSSCLARCSRKKLLLPRAFLARLPALGFTTENSSQEAAVGKTPAKRRHEINP